MNLELTVLCLIDALNDAKQYINNPNAIAEINAAIGSAQSDLKYKPEPYFDE
jgi:hypothetical protein